MGKILVLVEVQNSRVRKASLSGVTFAADLAGRTSGTFDIAVMGPGARAAAPSLAGFGAGKVHVLESPGLSSYLARPWAGAAASMVEAVGADCLVAVSTTWTRDMLPRVAARLGAGMVSEAVGIDGSGSDVMFRRPMWAGNVIATVRVKTPRCVICVRGTEFSPAEPSGGSSPVVELAVDVAADPAARHVSFEPTVSERPDLAEADVVVSGGRGLGDKASFWNTLNPLADYLGAAIGATRAVVDNGVAPNDLQVGQTGKAVAPSLYFAVGLSGAIQHLAGMKNSKVIVAINKDEEAPIFSIADYCLVGDALKLVPELVDTLKKS
ncbi:MAG TPA: electron transfer flavoprotein subunit alpha/FixB family protein [Myxococcota bacterium]|nr:electron transfer flavoprotein subunit alpha/FixB family protein [Myxococcota bacterium]HOC99048.1 electron transfer flavoprotein subunit alpha/FixB family protein [Myxococcota bacterium]HOH75916.1 electron transfer flavoprotein subunit alpha/FixB family protein [Myxococcota bacterium]